MEKRHAYQVVKLVLAAVITGLTCSALIFIFKNITETTEHHFFSFARSYKILNFVFPIAALSFIFILRNLLFKKNENKGIREITEGLSLRNQQVLGYKIPSHLINGFLTIVSGGSTGIEVSSVVAASAIGSVTNNKLHIIKKYRSELICAGAAAAITALFNSPMAGIFFAYEIMYKKVTRHFITLTGISVIAAWLFNLIMQQQPLFGITVDVWYYHALPYFILLGIVSGVSSVYLTKMVIILKRFSAQITNRYLAILSGGLIIGSIIYFFPELYGEGYATIEHYLFNLNSENIGPVLFLQLLLIIIIKPVITSVTLASGGDGGVFAPSLFMGALLGLLTALAFNLYFDAGVIPVNFMIVGMASVLCSSIQAPFTSIFLVCGITGSYILIIPLCIGCLTSRVTSHYIYPFSVYNYPIKK